jgi:16S rRNA (guanine966-N2)-methyltransferase
MSEKARGAIFNALGDITGLTFLDAYAGSGALSAEAISRGAAEGVAIDNDLAAWKAIVANFKQLGIDTVQAVRAGVATWSAANAELQFDLVFADPPYDDIKLSAVKRLVGHVKGGGIFVLSWPGGQVAPVFEGLKQAAHKPLGDIQLIFYRR